MKQKEREALQEKCLREELLERMLRVIPNEGKTEPLDGIYLTRSSSPTEMVYAVSQPCFCVIAQGRKEVYLGEEQFGYDPYSFLLATAELPVAGRIVQASPENPYVALRLILEPALVGSVMLELARPSSRASGTVKALTVSPLDTPLLECTVRLVRLLDSPTEARVLLPLLKREVAYRLLIGEQGERLRQMTVLAGHTHRIAQAVQRIRQEFNQPLCIEDIARQIGMSVSGFHHHFKAVTAMSPLQFQKQLRLQEARHLMLGEEFDAATAGYHVGYEDASHFNREYKRFFGEPPLRDVERLRDAVTVTVDV